MCQQQQAGFCGVGASSIALEQILAQLHLKKPDLTAECGLCNIESNCGLREAAHLCHSDKVFKLFKIHIRLFCHNRIDGMLFCSN